MRVSVKTLQRLVETINHKAMENGLPIVSLDCAYEGYRLVDSKHHEISWRVSCREMYYVLDSINTYIDMIVG